jgi:hypothetical protein
MSNLPKHQSTKPNAGTSAPPNNGVRPDTGGRTDPLIREAVTSRTTVVMTLAVLGRSGDATGLQHLRGKLAGIDGRGVWIEVDESAAQAIRGQIACGEPVGVSMRFGGTKYVAAVRAADYSGNYLPANFTRSISAMLIAWPVEFKPLQRRATQRIAVPPRCGVSVQIRRAAGRSEMTGSVTIADLTPGGIGLAVTDAPSLEIDERLTISLIQADRVAKFDGRVRHGRDTTAPGCPPSRHVGVQLTAPATKAGAADIQWLLNLIEMLDAAGAPDTTGPSGSTAPNPPSDPVRSAA